MFTDKFLALLRVAKANVIYENNKYNPDNDTYLSAYLDRKEAIDSARELIFAWEPIAYIMKWSVEDGSPDFLGVMDALKKANICV